MTGLWMAGFVLAIMGAAFVLYARDRAREQEQDELEDTTFAFPLDERLRVARCLRQDYDEGVMRRVSARRFRERIGASDEASS